MAAPAKKAAIKTVPVFSSLGATPSAGEATPKKPSKVEEAAAKQKDAAKDAKNLSGLVEKSAGDPDKRLHFIQLRVHPPKNSGRISPDRVNDKTSDDASDQSPMEPVSPAKVRTNSPLRVLSRKSSPAPDSLESAENS